MDCISRTIAATLAGACFASWASGAVTAELAGKPLDTYPHVRFVGAFNEDETAWIAVDPSRFLSLVGQTVDLYVVAARTAAAWGADTTLVDVRAGGPQTVTIAASGIQANTFAAAMPFELSADAGHGLGVGYDVVIDRNRDGRLDPDDLLDGGGDEPGFHVVHDTTQPGPLTVLTADYDVGDYGTPGPFQGQRVYYPATIATLEPAPLVVVSHGWTHEWDFYDYIGMHLASYGYVVMSHENEVGNGGPSATHSASLTTIANTDAFLGALDQIAGGVLDGHVDVGHIVWIGHSTGAEGIVRAYTRVMTGETVPVNFTATDVALLCPMCPVSWLSAAHVNPSGANLHEFMGGADTDTSGAPVDSWPQPAAVFERGAGNRSLTYVHGAGHGYFHDEGQGPPWASGPDLIGWPNTHDVVQGYLLPLVERYTRGNPAANDFLTRLYDDFHPRGIDTSVTCVTEYRDAADADKFVVDDYQSNADPARSSSGGTVDFDVSNVAERRMRDVDDSFAWTGTQPENGMTRARFDDDPRCVLFDWTSVVASFYELAIVSAERDLTDDEWISFRVCQGTRHPQTVTLNGPLSFTITLRDGCGVSSSIDFGAYGAVPRPYQRTGYGMGAGWQSEFATVRVRLADFTTDGSGLDLGDVVAIRFEFGADKGAATGRIGLDDVEIIRGSEPGHGPAGCCPADLDGDDVVNFTDLLLILTSWGPCPVCPEDLDGDGIIGLPDLLIVLSNWGACS